LSEKSQFILMAEYNQLMNQRIFKASSSLSNFLLTENKGAFFKSILETLSHIMVGDILWLKRFSNHLSSYESLQSIKEIKRPERLDTILFNDFNAFIEARKKLDDIIINYCHELNERDIEKTLNYTNFAGEVHTKRLGSLILHLFLHQVHHRGQVTTLLSQENVDFGETDLPEIVPDINTA
jgi:uncharacterized damage-inducible protein DinB